MRRLPPSTASSPGCAPAAGFSRCCGKIPNSSRFVALILGVAPRLADILAQNPHLIDPLIDPSFFGALPDESELEAELARALGETRGYEDVLDAIRLFGQEHMFLIGARILSGSVSAEQAGEVFARLADVLIRARAQQGGRRFCRRRTAACAAARPRSSRSAGSAPAR